MLTIPEAATAEEQRYARLLARKRLKYSMILLLGILIEAGLRIWGLMTADLSQALEFTHIPMVIFSLTIVMASYLVIIGAVVYLVGWIRGTPRLTSFGRLAWLMLFAALFDVFMVIEPALS